MTGLREKVNLLLQRAFRNGRPTASGLLLWSLVVAICAAVFVHDFRRDPIFGDQAPHLLQALSLAYDFDLKYDAGDMARWQAIGWMRTPVGLFYQTYSGGAAFAKPYLYSAFLAPFIRIAGVRFGVALANSAIFVLLIFVSLRMARLYLDRTLAPLLVLAFFFASNAYFYVFVIQPDLFHALLTVCFCYAALCHIQSNDNRLVCLMAVLLGVCVSEKFSMLFLLLPVFIYALMKTQLWRVRGLAVVLAVMAFGLSLLPYLHYSDYKSWNAYGGVRFYNVEGVPLAEPEKFVTGEGGVIGPASFSTLHLPTWEILRSAWYYVFGAYTGVFIFAPATVLFGVAAYCTPGRRAKILPWAAGIVLMVLSYLVFDTRNYFGGGQSLGNRWFLKAIPMAMALALEARLDLRRVKHLAFAAMILSAVLIYPHHLAPVHAYQRCVNSGWFQRWFPLEINQATTPDYVGGNGNPVNISWFPRPPRWYVNPPPEPEMVWLWQSGSFIPPLSRVLYRRHYFKLAGKTFFALLDNTQDGEVYATYHFGRAGQFRSTGKKASLLVRSQMSGVQVGVVPLGHASHLTASSAGSEQHFSLPVSLILQPEKSLPDHFYKIDFSGDDNFWLLKPHVLPDSMAPQRLLMP